MPETPDNPARTLADLILREAGNDELQAHVTVEVRTVRRAVRLDRTMIAQMIADEIQRQSQALNVQEIIRTTVANVLQERLENIRAMVRTNVVATFHQAYDKAWEEKTRQAGLGGIAARYMRELVDRIFDELKEPGW